jgi:lipopolysaccharide biosynthesis glycosyltransferase
MTTIVLCHFTLTTDIYSMMAEKCKQSIQDNMPNAIIKELVLQPDKKFKRTIDEAFYANLIKLKAWSENIEGNTIFLDADTIVLDDLSHVFENDFDIAYTGRKGNIKFNSGWCLSRIRERML